MSDPLLRACERILVRLRLLAQQHRTLLERHPRNAGEQKSLEEIEWQIEALRAKSRVYREALRRFSV